VLLCGDLLILNSAKNGKTEPSDIPDINKLKKIANINGIKIKFKATPWKRALMLVKNGKADGVINASMKPDRAKYALYPMKNGKLDGSRRLNPGKSYYIYKNRNSTIHWDGKRFTNVDGKIGAISGFAVLDDLSKHKNIKVITKNSKIGLVKDLIKGKISAYAAMEKDINNILNKYPKFKQNIIKEKQPIRKKNYFLIFSKKTYPTKKNEMEKIWDGLK
jgi:polar amino acid transport system substrate-binding protein